MGILSKFSRCPCGCYVPVEKDESKLPSLVETVSPDEAKGKKGKKRHGGKSDFQLTGAGHRIFSLEDRSPEEGAQPVRVVCVSDTHGHHEDLVLPPGDVLLHCGDFTPHDLTDGRLQAAKSLDRWLAKTVKQEGGFKEVIIVPGNHEAILEGSSEMACGNLFPRSKPVILWNGFHETFGGVRIFGSAVRPKRGFLYKKDAFGVKGLDKRRTQFEKCPDDVHLIATHGPAYGVFDMESAGRVGDLALHETIDRVRPLAHVHGHVHYSRGSMWSEHPISSSQTDSGDSADSKKPSRVLRLNVASIQNEDAQAQESGVALPVIIEIHGLKTPTTKKHGKRGKKRKGKRAKISKKESSAQKTLRDKSSSSSGVSAAETPTKGSEADRHVESSEESRSSDRENSES